MLCFIMMSVIKLFVLVLSVVVLYIFGVENG
jgi:hypothetical protein